MRGSELVPSTVDLFPYSTCGEHALPSLNPTLGSMECVSWLCGLGHSRISLNNLPPTMLLRLFKMGAHSALDTFDLNLDPDSNLLMINDGVHHT